MLLVNDKQLDLNTPIEDARGVEKTVLQEIENIRKTYGDKFPMIFKFVPEMYFEREVVNGKKTGRGKIVKRTKRVVGTRARRDVIINGRKQYIQYFDSMVRDPKTKEDKYSPKNIHLEERNALDEGDIDLIFFLLVVSPNIKSNYNSVNIKKSNNVAFQSVQHVDEINDAKRTLDKMRIVNEFDRMIASDLEDDEIRDLAIIYGVNSKTEIDLVRLSLKNKIESLDADKPHLDAYSEFMKKAGSLSSDEDELKIKDKIENAKDANVLVYDKNKWYICNGDEKEEICSRKGSQKKDEVLYERVKADKDLLDRL